MGFRLRLTVGERVGSADSVVVGLDDNVGDEVGAFVGEVVVGVSVGGTGALVGNGVGDEHSN